MMLVGVSEFWIGAAGYFPAMVALMLFSAFFSASEAAMFSLSWPQRRKMAEGTVKDRNILTLLENPDRLLTAVLFWNLTVNMGYFAIASKLSQNAEIEYGDSGAAAVAIGSLLSVIFFSELLPKSLAVINPLIVSRLVYLPLSTMVRILDPVIPPLQLITEFSRRLIWPGFKPEKYLDSSDLERAIELSTTDAKLIEQEKEVLRNLIQLSDIRVDEWMRPRTQYRVFLPPLSIHQLKGHITPSGYMLVCDRVSKDIVSAIRLNGLVFRDSVDLERAKQPIVNVPWCASIGSTLQLLLKESRSVAVVVNEFGDNIGILTLDDILEATFDLQQTRATRQYSRPAIEQYSPGKWRVTGMTSLKRIERALNHRLPDSRSVTIAGALQDQLHRFAQSGDKCTWGGIQWRIVDVPRRGEMLIEVDFGPQPEVESP